jgi:hypothetical protein
MRLPKEKLTWQEKQKASKTQCFQGFLTLVRMTGLEPTRLSTLEPDGKDTSVETML